MLGDQNNFWPCLRQLNDKSSLCHACVHVNNFSSKNYNAQRHAVVLKVPYLLRMKMCSRHADLFIRLFPRAITSEVPPPKVRKFQHFITIFSLTIAGISLLSCICTRPQVSSLMRVCNRSESFLIIFFMNFQNNF